ncbi:condensation domain-containing protein [Micrococcus luteus]|uniref:condensation domain-containing protein n=1 Tax=Bacteria TaxID=2 RepID=UPI00340DF9D9
MKKTSAIQETILLTQNIYANSPLYNVCGYALIKGALQASVLIKSIKYILNNADTVAIGSQCFTDGNLRNYDALEIEEYSIKSIDFSISGDPVQSCLDWMSSDIKIPFDTSENLLQVSLIKVANDKYYWYTKVHHLIFDGYSMSLFFNKVSTLYSLIIDGSYVHPVMNDFLYMDFIRGEADYRLSDSYKIDKDFWLKKLNVISENKAFNACMSMSASESLISSRQEITIPRSLYESISIFCKRFNCTAFHYFLSTLLILNRCYNEGGTVIGIPVFNRKNKKFKNTLGTFVNILPFNDLLIKGDSFIEVLIQVKNEIRECYKHQQFPLYDILQELDRPGNIYNISFSYQKNDYSAKLGDADATIQYLHSGAQQEDLVFHLLEYSATEDLKLSLDYKLNTFSAETIHRLLGCIYQ